MGATGPSGAKGSTGAAGALGGVGLPGSPGLNWRSTWSATTSYAAGDAVALNGSSYVALASSLADQPPSANWVALAEGATGAQGPTGAAGTTGAKGATGATGGDGASVVGAPEPPE